MHTEIGYSVVNCVCECMQVWHTEPLEPLPDVFISYLRKCSRGSGQSELTFSARALSTHYLIKFSEKIQLGQYPHAHSIAKKMVGGPGRGIDFPVGENQNFNSGPAPSQAHALLIIQGWKWGSCQGQVPADGYRPLGALCCGGSRHIGVQKQVVWWTHHGSLGRGWKVLTVCQDAVVP